MSKQSIYGIVPTLTEDGEGLKFFEPSIVFINEPGSQDPKTGIFKKPVCKSLDVTASHVYIVSKDDQHFIQKDAVMKAEKAKGLIKLVGPCETIEQAFAEVSKARPKTKMERLAVAEAANSIIEEKDKEIERLNKELSRM